LTVTLNTLKRDNSPLIPLETRSDRGFLLGKRGKREHKVRDAHAAGSLALATGARARRGGVGAGMISYRSLDGRPQMSGQRSAPNTFFDDVAGCAD